MMMTRDGVAGDRGCDKHSSGDKGRSLSWAGSQVALQSRAAMSVVVCHRLVENQMRGLDTESEVWSPVKYGKKKVELNCFIWMSLVFIAVLLSLVRQSFAKSLAELLGKIRSTISCETVEFILISVD